MTQRYSNRGGGWAAPIDPGRLHHLRKRVVLELVRIALTVQLVALALERVALTAQSVTLALERVALAARLPILTVEAVDRLQVRVKMGLRVVN